MTTLDLIEKYGIGHNCLSDAYALGMLHGLDRLEETCELAEKKAREDERPKAFSNGFNSGYEKGRADAFDEYMNKLCDMCIHAQNECWNLDCPFFGDGCKIIKIAEQLKEGAENG